METLACDVEAVCARDEETKEKKMPKTENEVEIPMLYKASGGKWCVSIKLVDLPGFQNTF